MTSFPSLSGMLGLMVLVIGWLLLGWWWRRRRDILRLFGKSVSNDEECISLDPGHLADVLGIVYVCSQLAIDCVVSSQSLWPCIIQHGY